MQEAALSIRKALTRTRRSRSSRALLASSSLDHACCSGAAKGHSVVLSCMVFSLVDAKLSSTISCISRASVLLPAFARFFESPLHSFVESVGCVGVGGRAGREGLPLRNQWVLP